MTRLCSLWQNQTRHKQKGSLSITVDCFFVCAAIDCSLKNSILYAIYLKHLLPTCIGGNIFYSVDISHKAVKSWGKHIYTHHISTKTINLPHQNCKLELFLEAITVIISVFPQNYSKIHLSVKHTG